MSNYVWEPDIQITEELAKTSIESQFPSLYPLKTIKHFGQGWDNKVFLVNEDLVFRFRHRKIAINSIEQENKLLKHIRSSINIEIPNPEYLGKPTSKHPYPFHGFRRVQGISACSADLTSAQRNASIIPLAHFLKSLHSTTLEEAVHLGAKPQVSGSDKTLVNKVIPEINDRVDNLIKKNIINIDKNAFKKEIELAYAAKLPEEKVLVHGDIYCRHLMFSQGKLTGIIDWGEVSVNSRAADLPVIFCFYPEECHQQFFDIYGEVDPDILQYARFIALHMALTFSLYAYNTNDKLLFSEGLSSIKRLNPKLLAN